MAKYYIEREAVVMGVLGLTIVDPMVAQYADAVLRQIQQAPAADVVEVVHGRWVPIKRKNIWGDETDLLECSACKKSDVDGKGITKRSDYCPNCGARMDGE